MCSQQLPLRRELLCLLKCFFVLNTELSQGLTQGGETNKYIDELGQTMIHTKSEEAEEVLTEQAKEKPVQASNQQQ
jgi:hypothetical protein